MTGQHVGDPGRLARAWAWWRQPPATLSRGFLFLVAGWAVLIEFAGPAGVRPLVLLGLAWLIGAALIVLWGFARGLSDRIEERNTARDAKLVEAATFWRDMERAQSTPEGNNPT